MASLRRGLKNDSIPMLLTWVHTGPPPWVLIQAPQLSCWDTLGNILELSILQGSDLKQREHTLPLTLLGIRIALL